MFLFSFHFFLPAVFCVIAVCTYILIHFLSLRFHNAHEWWFLQFIFAVNLNWNTKRPTGKSQELVSANTSTNNFSLKMEIQSSSYSPFYFNWNFKKSAYTKYIMGNMKQIDPITIYTKKKFHLQMTLFSAALRVMLFP